MNPSKMMRSFPGQTNKIIENMMRAAEIHREQGAHVSIYQMDVGSAGQPFDYVLRWDNEKDWARTREQSRSPEWQKFWESVSKDPSGELVMSSEFYNLDPSVPADVFEGRRADKLPVHTAGLGLSIIFLTIA